MVDKYKLTSEQHDAEAANIRAKLHLMTEEDRHEVMGRVNRYFCACCWRELEPPESCHCWNDE